jgi:UDP-N-acetylmuramyl pentapeptide synthase
MSLSILTVAIGLCVTIVYLVKYVYIFQIKEYRLDRIWARIEDKGLLHFLYGFDIRIPSTKHPRNIVLLLTGSVTLTLISALIPQTIWMGSVLIVAAPIMAFLLTVGGVLITSIPVALYRRNVMHKAHASLTYTRPTIIGITGSYGKSTTKDYLFHILSHSYKTAKTDRNQNTAVGVALSILKNLTKDTQYFVAEMGAYKQGEIEEITRIATPKVAVITAIGSQHLSLFGGKEALFKAKSEIAKHLPKDGRLFLPSNMDKILKFRLQRIAGCPVEEYEDVAHNPHNSALNGAVAVARYLGVSEDVIQKAVVTLSQPVHLRPQINPRGYVFIDCSYSSNAEGFIAHMHMLRSIKKPKKIILTSGIIELGKYRKDVYSKILQELPPHTTMYTSDKMFKVIARTSQSKSIIYHASHAKLTTIVEKLLDKDSAILIEGRFRADYIAGIIA